MNVVFIEATQSVDNVLGTELSLIIGSKCNITGLERERLLQGPLRDLNLLCVLPFPGSVVIYILAVVNVCIQLKLASFSLEVEVAERIVQNIVITMLMSLVAHGAIHIQFRLVGACGSPLRGNKLVVTLGFIGLVQVGDSAREF